MYQERSVIQIQQSPPRSHKSGSRHFVLLCTEMAALVKTAYDGYRYIFNECAGKKLQLKTDHVTYNLPQGNADLQHF